MSFLLLLVDATGAATTACLTARQFRELPGKEGLSVLFRPVRRDLLFQSAKLAGDLAYRILYAEGWLRSQLWVEWEVSGPHVNVTGRSSELLFALALITSKWEKPEGGYPIIAATGTLAADGTTLNEGNGGSVGGVRHTASKVAAAVRALAHESDSIVFYPKTDEEGVAAWRAQADIPPQIRLQPVETLEDALGILGIQLEKVYLGNPFRGLEHFDYGHRAIFFGRDAEIRAVVKRLVEREKVGLPGLLVEGASGSGKSSFLRAGVLPALVNPSAQSSEVQAVLRSRPVRRSVSLAIWRVGLVAAGADESALVGSIVSCWQNLPEITPAVLTQCQTFEELAAGLSNAWPSTQRFVWMLDQFEELFSLEFDGTLIERLGRFLTDLQAAGVWTLVSMRSDALADFKARRDLRKAFDSDGQYYLETLTATALDNVITQPASVANLRFEVSESGQRLEHVLREEAYTDRHNALPLLQFTLSELYLRRSGNLLTFSAYEAVGGLAGSVATTAAAILRLNPPEVQASLPKLFRSLVSVDDFGRPARRYTAMAEFTDNSPELRLLLQLVDARLCVTDSREGLAVVAFAHEALLRTWPALIDWLAVEAGLIQMRDLAQRDARIWQEHQESDDWLAAADKLQTFESLQASGISLSQSARRFIDRSVWKARRFIRIKRLAIGSIALLAVVASGASWVASQKQREAELQVAKTTEAQSRLLTETAATRLNEGALSYARGIILEVLSRAQSLKKVNPAAINVLQEVRAYDPQVAVLTGHTDAVRRAAYSPDGTRIVTTSLDGTARLWDARTGIELAVLPGTQRAVMCADFSPDGARVITASRSLSIWDARTGVLMFTIGDDKSRVSTAYYSSDGKIIVAAAGDVIFWDALSGRELRRIHLEASQVYSAALSRDGKYLVVVADDRQVRVLDVKTGKEMTRLIGHTDDVNSAFFSPDGTKIVTGANDSTARVWDARTGVLLKVLAGNTGQVWDAEFSPDGTQVVTVSTDKNARVFDVATGTLVRMLSGHKHIVTSARYSPDGQFILTTGYDGTARIWDARVGSATMTLINRAPVGQVAYSPDGSGLVTASEDTAVQIWDAKTGRPTAVLGGHQGGVSSARYSPDGHFIVTAAADGARIWDAGTATLVQKLSNQDGFQSASYSPDGLRIVTMAGDMTARIWDAHTFAQLALLKGHTNYLNSAVFSPDGSKILTASVDKSVRIWDARTGVQLNLLPHPDMLNAAAYSPDGTRIVTASEDKLARIWDAQSGKLVHVLLGHHSRIFDAAFSPDGRHVVTAARDYTVRIWDANSGEELAVLPGHEARVVSIAYSPDGTHIASGSIDKTVRIWDASIPADLPSQMIWEQAAESDPMTVVERTQLGLDLSDTESQLFAHSSGCDRNAAAYYDPDRQAAGVMRGDINADIALPSCIGLNGESTVGRQLYQTGRANLAKGDFRRAKDSLEAALAQGYRAAGIDLGDELLDAKADIYNPMTAVAHYERAWHDGVPIAAFKLGELYERGAVTRSGAPGGIAPDQGKAWAWYREGANVGEPNALGRIARMNEEKALKEASREASDKDLLMAFRLYATAAQQASKALWPDDAWKHWRYRRSTLARFLAREGMMQPVANAFKDVLAE